MLSRLRSLMHLAIRQDVRPADAVVVTALILAPTVAGRAAIRYYGLTADLPFIDREVMEAWIAFQAGVALPLIFGFLVAGLVARKVRPRSRPLAHACVQSVMLFVAGYSYLLGHSTDLYGVMSLFAVLSVGTFLFDSGVMRAGLVTFLSVVLVTTVAEQARLIPYAPLYAELPVVEGHLARSVLLQHGFSFLIVGAVAFFFLAMTQQLRVFQRAAESANQAKSRLLAAASHDLRQPLHAMGFFVEGLTTRVSDGEAREIVERLRVSADELGQMFDSLLDLSKIEAGAVEPEVTCFALDPVIERLIGEFEPVAHEKGLLLRRVPTAARVETDRLLLGRMLQNLLSNAIRHTDQGEVTVRGTLQGDGLEIEVADTGPGIPIERQREVFEEFVQLSEAPAEGLGLGLAIVERLGRLLGHPVRLDSHGGRGSTFRVRVPLAATDEPSSPSPPTAERAHRLDGRLVVVIDDDLSILEALRTTLRQWGCEVVVASSVEDALFGLGRFDRPPDVILADHQLDGGSTGVEAVQQVRAEAGTEIPAVVITGATQSEVASAIAAAGLPKLNKPVKPHRLRAVLLETLRD